MKIIREIHRFDDRPYRVEIEVWEGQWDHSRSFATKSGALAHADDLAGTGRLNVRVVKA